MKNSEILINVIGLGYIGLPTALMLASHGNHVVGTDYNEDLVKQLVEGRITFEEAGLGELFDNALNSGIVFSNNYLEADVYIVSVPTPYFKQTKKIDSKYVENAVKECLKVCKDNSIIVIESTISPGTIDSCVRPLIKESKKNNVELCHAPERIIPGNMIYELSNNSRTIGADNYEVGCKIKDIYKSFCKGEIVVTEIKTAEMTKVIENTYRAVNIAFANELMKICYENNMNVYDIINICNMHPRVNILSPGPGVGGHCIPVDPWFLVGDYPMETKIIGQAMRINEGMPEFVLTQLSEILEKEGKRDYSKIGIYGLTYKENVDDYRESPTLQLIDFQSKHIGTKFKVYDPYIMNKITDNQYFDFDEFLDEIEVLVIMVAHRQIIDESLAIKNKIVLDTRNCIKEPGDKYYKLGLRW